MRIIPKISLSRVDFLEINTIKDLRSLINYIDLIYIFQENKRLIKKFVYISLKYFKSPSISIKLSYILYTSKEIRKVNFLFYIKTVKDLKHIKRTASSSIFIGSLAFKKLLFL